MQENIDGNESSSSSQNDPEPEEYAFDQFVGHRGTEKQTEHIVRWYGYGPEKNTYEPASEIILMSSSAFGLPGADTESHNTKNSVSRTYSERGRPSLD